MGMRKKTIYLEHGLKEQIALAVKERMALRGLNLEDLRRETGVHFNSLQAITFQRGYTIDTLLRVCLFLDIEINVIN